MVFLRCNSLACVSGRLYLCPKPSGTQLHLSHEAAWISQSGYINKMPIYTREEDCALNGKFPKEQDSSVKAWTEADSLRTLAASRAREELGRGSGWKNKRTLSCPLVTRAKPVCQICCPRKSCKCNLKKAEGVAWLPWLPLECARPEEGMVSYDRWASLDEG